MAVAVATRSDGGGGGGGCGRQGRPDGSVTAPIRRKGVLATRDLGGSAREGDSLTGCGSPSPSSAVPRRPAGRPRGGDAMAATGVVC